MSQRPTSHTPTGSGQVSRRAVLAGAGAAVAAAAVPLGAAGAAAAPPRSGRAAATVILDGQVFTGTGDTAQAVALGKGGEILAVGSNREVRRFAGHGTEVVDAAGGTIMAGIRDGHTHPLGAAEQSLNPSLMNANLTVPQFQQAVQAMLDETDDKEPDGWLRVVDWNPVGLLPTGTVANKSMLDALDTSRPIYVQGSDYHNALVNSRALALAGITDSTPNPDGGEIVRDAGGEATGLLKDSAQDLVGAVIPPPGADELASAYAAMATMLLGQGITSFMDAACVEANLETYRSLLADGVLPQRVIPALVVDSELATTPKQAREYLADLRRRYGGHRRMPISTVKVFMDGVIEYPAQTAALLRPYLDADGKPTDNRGDLYVSNEDFRSLAVSLDRAGWQIHCHAIGDRGVRVALNGFEAARRANRDRRNRHTIGHLQLVHPDDYPRFRRWSVLACMQLQWAVRNTWTVDALRPFIGTERFRRLYPAASMAQHGARLTGGSDWPVDPLWAMNQIATAIDRSGPYAEYDKPLNLSEGLRRRQSLLMHTKGSAYQLNERGPAVVAPGRTGDLIVLDRVITRGGADRIRNAQVAYTVIGGRVVYSADSAAARSATRQAQARQVRASLLGTARTNGARPCCGGTH